MEPILNTVEPDAAAAAGQLQPADLPMGSQRVPLGQLLVAEGFISDLQLDQALHVGGQTGERLGEVVVRQGLASEEDIARLLAEQWDLSYVDRASIWFDADALARLSREDAQRLEAMPTRVEDGRVVVAVAEPTEQRLAALREAIGEDTVVIVVPKTALEAGLHSELLASNGQGSPPTRKERKERREAKRSATAAAEAQVNDPDEDEPYELPPRLTKPTPLPDWADLSPRDESPTVVSLQPPVDLQSQSAGTLARSLAELIEAQIGSVQQASADDIEKLAALERRVVQLERELAGNRAALVELGRHLQAIAGILGKL